MQTAKIPADGSPTAGNQPRTGPEQKNSVLFRSLYSLREADGNNPAGLGDVLRQAPFEPGKPSLIIAHTVKGRGVSFMENAVEWHHRVPNDEEFARAMEELNAAEAKLSGN